jgi:hypothetical protein
MSESPMKFRIIGAIVNIEPIAEGRAVRIRQFLKETYGASHWRKLKGIAFVENDDGWIGNAEIHWFEARGVGRVRWKIKRRLYP